jgi:hypothetical protein
MEAFNFGGNGLAPLERIYHSCEGESHIGGIDRISKALQPGISISASIRKQQGKKLSAEMNYDSEYTVHISGPADQWGMSASKIL